MYAMEVMPLTVPRKKLLFGSPKVYVLGILVRRSGSMNKYMKKDTCSAAYICRSCLHIIS